MMLLRSRLYLSASKFTLTAKEIRIKTWTQRWPVPIGVLYRIVDALEEALPPHVGFHLFGVKSTALAKLRDRTRVVSADSIAWNYGARREAFAKRIPKTKELLCGKMENWVVRQRRLTEAGAQLVML
jgi:hypothetical protein